MLPKMGTTLHSEPANKLSYPEAIAVALRKDLGKSHRAIKIAMGWTNASERTVKNWFSGKIGPSGKHLVALLHHSDITLDALLKLAERERPTIVVGLDEARRRVAEILGALDRLLAEEAKHPTKKAGSV